MTQKEFIQQYQKLSKPEIITFLQEHQGEDLGTPILGRAFEKLYIDVSVGQTAESVAISELRQLHHSFNVNNGAVWSRKNGRCYLGRKYNIVNEKEKGHIVSVSCNGFNSDPSTICSKKIEISLLKELEDATDTYKSLKMALEPDSSHIKPEILEEIMDTVNDTEIKMLNIIEQITQKL